MKHLLLIASALLILDITAFGQACPNGGFESWNTTNFNEPNGWFTGNLHSIQKMGVQPVTKVSGQSGFALRIQTYIANGDTSDSFISNSAAGDPTKGQGGVPFSQQPTALTGYYRYNLPGNDSAGILVVFKKNTVVITTAFFMFRGTGSQNTFTAFSFPLTVSSAPDSVIIAAVSSNLLSGVGIENGSFLELDGLAFAGASQTIPNGDFENWMPHSFESPVGWYAEGDSIYKTADHHDGSFAVAMRTSLSPDGRINGSGISTGQNSNNGLHGGLPYTGMIDTLIGYYKYIPSGADTGNVFVSLYKNGSPVGGNGYFLNAASNYTYFQVPVNAFSTPDTMLIGIVSSAFNNPGLGSTLYIDGLTLKSMLVGMSETSASDKKLLVYPNPAADVINIEFSHVAGSALVMIYDVSGRMVKESSVIVRGSSQVNVADLPRGLYIVELKCGQESFRSMFAKE